MIRRNLIRLIDKYLTDTASPEERAFIDTWFDSLSTGPSCIDTLNEEQLREIGKEIFSGILRRIEELRNPLYEIKQPSTSDLGYKPALFQEKYIELVRHPPLLQPLFRPILSSDDICFQPMLQYLSLKHRQTLAWAQIDKLSMQQLAVKLRLTTSGARSRLQRAQQKLSAIVRRCCTYQYDSTGRALSCIIQNVPGCCEPVTTII